VLAAVRERLADDLDAPGALAVVDGWADEVLSGLTAGPAELGGPAEPEPAEAGPAEPGERSAAELVRDTVDALLGVVL
jgi:L-cysteine:1D-myo-inositol 2-amino-2-deoxy-alpha-D-glucopyranoside ligase